MNGHRALQHGVGNSSVHHVEDAVNRLVPAGSENCRPEDMVCFGIRGHHHEALRLALFAGATNAGHGTAADEERPAGRTRLRLGNADAAERRIDV